MQIKKPHRRGTTYPLCELLADHEQGQSAFQLDHFVVARSGCTLYGRYKQALRKLAGRVESVRTIAAEQRRLTLEIEELLARLCFRRLARKRRTLELEQKRRQWQTLARQLQTARRERAHFYRLACRYKSMLGPLDASMRRTLDEHLWRTKIKAMAAIDFVCYGGIREKTAELLLCLPLALRKRLIEDIRHREALIAWLERYDPTVPKLHHNGRAADRLA